MQDCKHFKTLTTMATNFKLTVSAEGTRAQIAAELRGLAKNIDNDSSNTSDNDLSGEEWESNVIFAQIIEQ